MWEWFKKIVQSTTEAIGKRSGIIACCFLVVAAVVLAATVIAPMIMTVAAPVITYMGYGAAAAGGISLVSGAYYIGRQSGLSDGQEQAAARIQDARNASMILGRVTAETVLDAQENVVATTATATVVTALDTTVAQQGLLLNNLTTRVDDADARQDSAQVELQHQFDDLRRENSSMNARLSQLEGLLANGLFANNPSVLPRQGAAANDENGLRQRGRQQSQA